MTADPVAGQVERPLLTIKDLKVHYPVRAGAFRRAAGHIRAVDGVDLTVRRGENVGVVGESGCGKTTLGLSVLRAHDRVRGEIHYLRADGTSVDLARLSRKELKPCRREIRMIFQDPHSSLNPRLTLLDIIGEPLKVNGVATGQELVDRVGEMLRKVGLRPEHMRRYPHAFSGGERQRISIARALVLQPRLVVADEAVSALDVSVRAQILNLLQDLQDELGLTFLFISHDLSIVECVCDRVAVMYLGRVVELADTAALYAQPAHPYTEALLSAVPKPDPRLRRARQRIVLQGDVPDPANPPSGCAFRTRCRFATQLCAERTPELREVAPKQYSACHYAGELALRGIQ
ncbi:ATP-binding cassette domain-containing protein [Saccharopolyspora sp. K220]|uniref:ABC transporter ATP-binding protein n=1 Tax=Saccharopolyspora soli TaxID=2926618 RepID=UPI001F5A0E4F|nr:oligopeptide/dipeptide ABC transporter ATP-binding protein [Saccharopolyspora soli]MCI2422740.1 ATP-binding cassette domain-containing protein [Saccharopolyspora soli]